MIAMQRFEDTSDTRITQDATNLRSYLVEPDKNIAV